MMSKAMYKNTIILAILVLFALTVSAQEDGKKVKETEYDTEMHTRLRDHLTHDKVPKLSSVMMPV